MPSTKQIHSKNTHTTLAYGKDGKVHNTSGNSVKHGRKLQLGDRRIYSSMYPNKNKAVHQHGTTLGNVLSGTHGSAHVRIAHKGTLAHGQTTQAGGSALGITKQSLTTATSGAGVKT